MVSPMILKEKKHDRFEWFELYILQWTTVNAYFVYTVVVRVSCGKSGKTRRTTVWFLGRWRTTAVFVGFCVFRHQKRRRIGQTGCQCRGALSVGRSGHSGENPDVLCGPYHRKGNLTKRNGMLTVLKIKTRIASERVLRCTTRRIV